MNKTPISPTGAPPIWTRVLPCLIAFAATLMASPGYAVSIPALPLQSGAAYPPANIQFILDDSGSMGWDYMPDDLANNIFTRKNYIRNTIYYDPATDYKAWIQPADNNTRFTGGRSYTSAYSHDSLIGTSSSTINLGSSTQTYYVPKNPATVTVASTESSYYRYEIASGGTSVVRSEWGPASSSSSPAGFPKSNLSGTKNNLEHVSSFIVPANVSQLVVSSSGGSHGSNGGVNNNNGDGADLYVRFNNANVTNNPTCSSTSGNNNESCTLNNPTAGIWWVGLEADSSYKGVTMTVTFLVNNACGTPGGSGSNGWINCVPVTPTGRTVAAELANYATWYSYHRTRIKVAKAGASEAFSQLGDQMRVGYDSIWNRNAFAIPVGTNDGLFKSGNRTAWFQHLQDANASSGTPLLGALQRAGNNIMQTGGAGVWGPETGTNQVSCRQNFAIMTTDGYWNSSSGFTSVGDTDGTAGPTITSSLGNSYTYVVEKPYYDNFVETSTKSRPNTLADVAMQYWKNDLRTTLENNVPTSFADPAFWQHMVTFGVSIGLKGRLDPKVDLPSITNGSKNWGDPTNTEDEDRIDDLFHASVNGRGSFITAADPRQFVDGLINALATVAARLGSASNVTANSTSLSSDTRVFQASYISGTWSGELSAYDVTSAGIGLTPAWRASTGIPTSGRKVLTWSGAAVVNFPTALQTTLLDQSTRGLSPVNGADNANYVKGVQTKEKIKGGVLRDRGSNVLGDIVNSSPFYAKDSETIFVGSNDGMLHAFNALTGAERFAYVPGGVNMSDLATYSDPQYTHKFFVDGPIVVSSKKQTPGKNYLVGALGRGGKGVFGLDVTTPDSFSAASPAWEVSVGTNLGQVLGEPLLVTLNDVGNTKAVIFGNGINSISGNAVLYVVNLATGVVIQQIDTGVGGDNGLSAPRGWDNNGDGTVDYVYAGDLKGNLWKFDFTGTIGSLAFGGGAMFTTAAGQPITAGVALARDPSTGKRWVFIGTGSFMTNGDLIDTTVQSMYGVIDEGSTTINRASLVKRDILVLGVLNGRAVRGFEPATTLPAGKLGWFIDLDKPSPGERIVSRPQVRGSVLITASLIPPTNNSCEAGGSGFLNAVDTFTGTSTSAPYFDANGDGVVDAKDTIATGNGPVPIGSIDLGVGMPTLPTVIDEILVVGGSSGGLGTVTVNPLGGSVKRVSWREILKD